MTRDTITRGRKKENPDATWAKLKYDRQIVAIAKVAGATTIYSDDEDIRTIAATANIQVIGIADLPLPAEAAQMDWLKGLEEAPAYVESAPDDEDEEAGEPETEEPGRP